MKTKLLTLTFFLLIINFGTLAQVQLTACSNQSNGTQNFDLTWAIPDLLGIQNPEDFTFTFHISQTNAQANVNPISNPSNFSNTSNPQLIWVRFVSISTSEVTINSFSLQVNPIPYSSSGASLLFCHPTEPPLFNLDDSIPQFLASMYYYHYDTTTFSFFTTYSNAIENENEIQDSMFIPTIFPRQTIYVRLTDVTTGCFSINTVTLNTSNNCNSDCQIATNITTNDITETSINVTWSNATNSSNVPVLWFVGIVPFGESFNGSYNLRTQTPSFTFAGLTQNTCYSIYIASYCSITGVFSISTTGPFDVCLIDCTNNGQCPEQLNLIAFIDENNNGIKDDNEILFNSGSFVYEINDSGETIYGNSGNGNFSIFEPNPDNSYNFSFEVNDALTAHFSSTATYSNITAPEGSGLSTYYFPITSIQPYADVSVTLLGNSQPRPGFTYTNTIAIKNNSYTTVPFGNISFAKDNDVTIISVSEISIVSTAAGFDYSYSDLAPFETRNLTVTMQVPTMPTVNLGDVLTNSVSIEAIEDEVNLTNNTFSLSQVVVGSYDPNDKNESHGGKIVFADFTADDYLYYTIRFENTGTAAAEFIRIEDTLENGIDETTFEMLNASHQYNVRRTDNQLVWHFLDIDLPPTIEDAELSQGFIHFKIKPKPGFAIGDVIENTAEIYFDYNPPIITNTIETEFVENLSVADFSNSTVILYPNPTNDSFQIKLNGNDAIQQISVYDVVGKRIYYTENLNLNSTSVDVNNFNRGIYLVEVITTSNQKLVNKIVKQ